MSFVTKIVSSAVNSIGGGLTGTSLNINGLNITVGEKIADGGYGIIYRCTDSRGQTYALKALQAPDEEHYQAIMQEYEIHKRCADHPNIVKVYGMTSNPGTRQATILMEFCTDDLIKHINAVFHQGFDDRTIVEIFAEVCEAVDHVHSLNPPVIHRDLKPENVLRNEGKWKLCDFGSATTRVYTLKTSQERNEASDDLEKNTTALYRAPEMCDLFRRQPINSKADVWALGCILYKLCTFKDAFGEGANLQILNVKYQWPPQKNINQKFKDIVKFIFNTNPNARPSARDVLGELQRQFPDWVDSRWKQTGSSSQNQASSGQDSFNPFAQSQASNQNKSSERFDPFGQQQQPQQQQQPRRNQSQDRYDPFSQQQQQQQQQGSFPQRQQSQLQQRQHQHRQNRQQQQQQQQPQFNPFGKEQKSYQQPQEGDDGTFDPFSGLQQNSNSLIDEPQQPSGDGPMFNPFAGQQQQPAQQQEQMFNPFTSNQQNDDGNTFDPFSNVPQQNMQQQNMQQQPQAMFNPFEGNDSQQQQQQTFNPFGSSNQPARAPAHQPPRLGSGGTYDPFGQTAPAPSSDLNGDSISLLDTNDSPAPMALATSNAPLPGGFDDISFNPNNNKMDPRRAETDTANFIKDCLSLDEYELSSVLFSVNSAKKDTQFFLNLLHQSGTKGPQVAKAIPQLSGPLGAVIESRKTLATNFPQYEGNFALTSFMKQHKENPVPIGQPPICPESAKELLEHMNQVISMIRALPTQASGEEALITYQVTAFVLAKLKQFKINEGYTVNTAIPLFKNQHTQLKRAFSFVKPPMKFPADPFNFNDENFLKRIRPPQSKQV